MISNAQEVTTYYFIRHAEKLRIDKTDKNPNLNFNGYKRAEAWKDVFSNVPFDAIYSTDYNRTKLTAKPTATSKNLPILFTIQTSCIPKPFKIIQRGKLY